MLVVWQHSSESFVLQPAIAANGTILADMAWAVDFGRIGVVCFFLISGFVIPFSFSSGPAPIKTFAIHRLFRLYPAYWLSIAGVVLLSTTLFNQSWNTTAIVANATMLQQFFGVPHMQGLYWTLTLELIFYVICALLYWRGMLFNPWVLTSAIFAIVGLYGGGQLLTRFVPVFQHIDREIIHLIFTMGFMFLGALIRQCYVKPTRQIRRLCWVSAAALLIFPLVSVAIYILKDVDLGFLRFGAAYPLAFTLFMTGLYLIKLRARALVWLGAISYSVYLFHPLAIMCVNWTLKQSWFNNFRDCHVSVYMTVVVLITVAVSSFVYRWVELPAIAWGRQLSQRYIQPKIKSITDSAQTQG